jgi:hypothetical protein
MDNASSLLDLQETDLGILRMSKRLDEMPEKQAIITARHKIREVSELRLKAEALVSKLQRGVKLNEDEVAGLREKIAAEQAKLNSEEGSDPRQAAFIAREMDSLRRRAEKLELAQLELMERAEKATGQVAKVVAALAQLAKQEAALTEQFKVKGGELQTELETLRVRRDQIAATTDPELLERYEALRGSKGGVGAGRLSGDTCTACRMELPAEDVAHLREAGGVGACPACHRLLVVVADEDE